MVLRGEIREGVHELFKGETLLLTRIDRLSRRLGQLQRASRPAPAPAAEIEADATMPDAREAPLGANSAASPSFNEDVEIVDAESDADEDAQDTNPRTMSNKLRTLVTRCFRGYVREANGIFTTFTMSASPVALEIQPEVIIIDEASQAIEGAAVYPLVQHVESCRNVMLVGNHYQLPPCVLTVRANNPFQAQAKLSLFERLIRARVENVCLLTTQYRMDPTISAVVNGIIYGGQLRDGPNVINPTREGLPQMRRWLASLWSRVRGAGPAPNSSTVLVQPREAPKEWMWGS